MRPWPLHFEPIDATTSVPAAAHSPEPDIAGWEATHPRHTKCYGPHSVRKPRHNQPQPQPQASFSQVRNASYLHSSSSTLPNGTQCVQCSSTPPRHLPPMTSCGLRLKIITHLPQVLTLPPPPASVPLSATRSPPASPPLEQKADRDHSRSTISLSVPSLLPPPHVTSTLFSPWGPPAPAPAPPSSRLTPAPRPAPSSWPPPCPPPCRRPCPPPRPPPPPGWRTAP